MNVSPSPKTHPHMIRHLITSVLLALCIGCGQKETLTMEPLEVNSERCADCPEVSISLPLVTNSGKVARVVNTALREEVIALLSFDDSVAISNLEEAVTSFHKGYRHIRNLYPDEMPGWKAEISAEVSYEDKNWLSIRLNAYTYTGGAHGYGSVRYLNFDKSRGIELETWELFRDQGEFQRFAEGKFRLQEQIPADKPINSTGFMFEDGRFYLPENIGLTAEGVQLHYNQYEVASYADGPIELTLPFGEVKKFLNNPNKS